VDLTQATFLLIQVRRGKAPWAQILWDPIHPVTKSTHISQDTASSKKLKSLLGELNIGFQEAYTEKPLAQKAH